MDAEGIHPNVREPAWRATLAALAVAVIALVLSTSGASATPPARGTLAYSVCPSGSPCLRSWIGAWDLGAARARALTARVRPGDTRIDDNPAWSPDGRTLAFLRVAPTSSGIHAVGADGRRLRRVVALTRASAGADNFMGPAWSPDGRQVVFDRYGAVECSGAKPFRHRLTIAKVDGSGTRDVPILARPVEYGTVFPLLSWSPDGTRLLVSLAYGEYDDEDPSGCRFHGPAPSELYAVAIDGRGRRLLARSDAEFDAAAWSPDGRRVAYARCFYTEDEGGTVKCNLDVVSADGAGRRTLVSAGELESGGIGWSPKGDEVVANVGGSLVAVDVNSRRRRRLGPSGVILGVSPDGRYVATGGQLLRLQPLARTGASVWLTTPLPPGAAWLRGGIDLFLRR